MAASSAADPPDPPWRSLCKHVKVNNPAEDTTWNEIKCRKLADAWLNVMPQAVKQLVKKGCLKGKPLVAKQVDCSPKDIEMHEWWLRILLELWPDRNSSNYFVADSLLMLDKKCDCNLLKGDSNHQADTCVLAAAKLLKMCSKVCRLNRDPKRNPGTLPFSGFEWNSRK